MVHTDASIVWRSLSPAPFSCLLSGLPVIQLQQHDTHKAGWEVIASPPPPIHRKGAEGSQRLKRQKGEA